MVLNFHFEYPEREAEENLDSFLLKSQTAQRLNEMKDAINGLINSVKNFDKLESLRKEIKNLKEIINELYRENQQLKETIDLIVAKNNFQE